jgi:hypothetical protein
MLRLERFIGILTKKFQQSSSIMHQAVKIGFYNLKHFVVVGDTCKTLHYLIINVVAELRRFKVSMSYSLSLLGTSVGSSGPCNLK